MRAASALDSCKNVFAPAPSRPTASAIARIPSSRFRSALAGLQAAYDSLPKLGPNNDRDFRNAYLDLQQSLLADTLRAYFAALRNERVTEVLSNTAALQECSQELRRVRERN